MKDTLKGYANDSAVAFSSGTVADAANGGGHTMLVVCLTIMAPIIKEVLFRLIDKWYSKKEK